MAKKDFLLSIVLPVYNEEHNISSLLEALIPVIEPYNYEIIFIDDGSKDNTQEAIKKYTDSDKRIKYLKFQRNFGHQIAIAAGYEKAKGDCVISMDADLQDPPSAIPQMIEKWLQGALVVYAKRSKRDVDPYLKKTTAQLFYRFINSLSDVPIPQDVGDFRLLDKKVVQFINGLSEQPQFLRGLVAWGGFPSDTIYFERAPRHAGRTHYTLARMMNFALEGITSFSTKPLRIATFLGFAAAVVGFFGIIYAIVGKYVLPSQWVTGWTALFVGIMFIGGVQLITIGIIGEYIGKIYKEIQKRPRYLLSEEVNL